MVDLVERYAGTQINVAPDGSPVFTRDIDSQEIYARAVRGPDNGPLRATPRITVVKSPTGT